MNMVLGQKLVEYRGSAFYDQLFYVISKRLLEGSDKCVVS